MRPRKWVPASIYPLQRSPSGLFRAEARRIFHYIISVKPMIALSGVRSSWLILETNCDLCWLAICNWSVFILDSVKQSDILDRDHRLVGESLTSSICLSVNG